MQSKTDCNENNDTQSEGGARRIVVTTLNQVFVELLRRGYIPGQTLFYYRTRNDKEIDFVTRKGAKVERLIQVCYDMTSGKTRKRELDALVEAAEELHCDNLLVITNLQEEKIEWKDKRIAVKPVSQF